MTFITTPEIIGLERGLEQGIQQGIQQREVKMLSHQLLLKFSIIPPTYQKRLETADTDTLMLWSERLLNAQTIEEVFN